MVPVIVESVTPRFDSHSATPFSVGHFNLSEDDFNHQNKQIMTSLYHRAMDLAQCLIRNKCSINISQTSSLRFCYSSLNKMAVWNQECGAAGKTLAAKPEDLRSIQLPQVVL